MEFSFMLVLFLVIKYVAFCLFNLSQFGSLGREEKLEVIIQQSLMQSL